MRTKLLFTSLCLAWLATAGAAASTDGGRDDGQPRAEEGQAYKKRDWKSRFTIGGYGEAVFSRNFYSENWKRYSDAPKFKDDKGHNRFDLPHVVIMLGYDFGKGWSMGTEIEFEHGGTESAVEIEEEETGEYEQEIERGGEVALEQFWIQKSFDQTLNLRLGHMVVPVGLVNSGHLPTQFFGVYRPEGDNTIIPCTWHETGISLWGRTRDWRYEVMLVAGLDADRFNNQNWIQGGAGSPYEFKIGNSVAGAARLDWYGVRGLRLGVSGYFGNSASNSLKRDKFKELKGRVGIGAFDFEYAGHGLVARGSFLYGHLGNSGEISEANRSLKGYGISPGTNIGSDAMSAGVEAGYDLFSLSDKLRAKGQRMYVFFRYDFYDPMWRMGKTRRGQQLLDEEQWGRQRFAAGINYFPMDDIVIKAEYAYRKFKSQFNDEPALSLGVAYAGLFTK